MGQCASSTTHPLVGGEVSVAATASSLFSCSGVDIPVQTKESSSYSSECVYDHRGHKHTQRSRIKNKHNHDNNNIRKTFLRIHRPDISQKCIIDPDEVNKILYKQTDTLLHRRALLQNMGSGNNADDTAKYLLMEAIHSKYSEDYGNGVVRVDKQQQGRNRSETNNRYDEFSDIGATSMISGMTTSSRSTILAGNIAKKSLNLNRMHSLIYDGDETVITGKTSAETSSMTILNSDSEHGVDEGMEGTGQGSIQHHMDRAGQVMQKEPSVVATQVNSLNLLSRFAKQHGSDIDARRSQYLSVLRLNMRARLGYFYSQRYLLMFKDGPKPKGVHTPKHKHDIPDLALNSSSEISDSSGKSFGIDFGALPPTRPIKCSVTDEAFLDLAVTGSLGLIPRQGSSTSSGNSKKVMNNGNLKSPDHYIVLINRRSGIPLAVCAMKAASGYPVVRIYATRQRVYGQRPAATTQQLGLEWATDLPLYAWSEVVSEGDFPNAMKFQLFMSNGSNGRFSTQASYEASFDDTLDEPIIKIVGRTDMERGSSGCALISIKADEDTSSITSNRSRSQHHPGLSFQMDLAQGIDPALMICFTAIADEIIEKSMRTQCKERAERKIRKVSWVKKRTGGV